MSSKSNLNPIKRILTLVLAVAMVFSVNLTSMTAHAAVAKPTKQTSLGSTNGDIDGITLNGNTAAFYKDDNDSTNVYIRYMFPTSTSLSTLSNVTVAIDTVEDITVDGVAKGESFTADLLNKSLNVNVGGTNYILAAGIEGGDIDLVKNPMSGYVSSVTLNGTTADVTRTITAGACIGNSYYAENKLEWTSESLAISATGVAAPADSCTVAYTVSGGSTGNETVDLSTTSKKLTINGKTYTINATFAAQTSGFVATSENFWIDFTELNTAMEKKEKLNDGYDWTTIGKQIKEIQTAQTAWYATNPTFDEGATCMDVLQAFLKFATTSPNKYFTCGTTDVDENCTYVQNIDGLCPFTLANGMDGWMYTDNPYEAGKKPSEWYTAPIGAADYTLSNSSTIAWFFTTNYGTHPW